MDELQEILRVKHQKYKMSDSEAVLTAYRLEFHKLVTEDEYTVDFLSKRENYGQGFIVELKDGHYCEWRGLKKEELLLIAIAFLDYEACEYFKENDLLS